MLKPLIGSHARGVLRHALSRLGVVAAMLGLSHAALGAVVYNNGAPNEVSGTLMTDFVVAENFTLGTAASISNIRFWSIQSSFADYAGSVYWAVYSDVASLPGAVVQGGVTATVAEVATGLSTGFGYAEYLLDIPVTFALGAGNYWLALHNGPLANTATTEMLWSTTTLAVGASGVYKDGTWIDSGEEHAFRLDGTTTVVPEPATLALFVGGLLAAGAMRRKSSQSPSPVTKE